MLTLTYFWIFGLIFAHSKAVQYSKAVKYIVKLCLFMVEIYLIVFFSVLIFCFLFLDIFFSILSVN